MTLHQLSDEVFFIGPPLSAGKLPAVFYFSLSAQESLTLNPINQPVTYLSQFPLRIFSITLPGHQNNLPAKKALNLWAEEIEKGHNVIQDVILKTKEVVDFLVEHNYLLDDKLAIAGLSRGAFVATHVAAHIPLFKVVLGFAPLTRLDRAKEFESIGNTPLMESLQLSQVISRLTHRSLRFYIGNLDTRVCTRSCFDFIETLAKKALQDLVRSPQVELIISPSIGKDGHGTSEEIFIQGARWIAQQLRVVDGM